MKKYFPLALKILKIVLLCVVFLYGVAYIYVTANKKKIIAQVTKEISDNLNGEVKIKNADISFFKSFPKIAVEVNNISITDTLFPIHKHTFFAAEYLFVNLSIVNLIRGKSPLNGIKIKQGSIFLFTDSTGYSNSYLLQSKKDPAGGPKKTNKNITLKNILLQQVRITFQDLKKDKFHDVYVKNLKIALNNEGENLVMDTKAALIVKSLAFNVPRGTFLKEALFEGNFEMSYGKKSQLLIFKNIEVALSGHPYMLTGSFDLGDKNPGFTLKINTKNALYEDIKKLMPRRIDSSLSKVSVNSPINAEASLYGPLKGGEPYIVARWQVKDASLKTFFMDFDHASFSGYYKNEVAPGLPRKDPNSIISISNFSGDWHGLKVTSNSIEILNLFIPQLTCDLHSAFPLSSLNEVLNSESVKLTSGDGEVTLNYKGPVERNNNTNSFLNGSIRFKNGKLLYTPRNVLMTDVSGLLHFKNSNVVIENIQCNVLNNKIVMNGTANNALTLMSSDPNKVSIYYNIYSPKLNLESFTYLLKSRTPVKSVQKNQLGSLSNKIDNLLEKSRIEVDLKADNLMYKQFNGNNLQAGITILQDRYVLDRVSMNLAGGSMAMKGQLINLLNNRHKASVTADLQRVNVQKVLFAFNNFNQDAITDKNLEGILTANANVNIDINDNGQVLPASSMGVVDFSLKKGALNNFEPIKKIQNIIFKKRDFDNVQFAELKNKLEINKGEIKINRMEVQSSVISFFVEGLYSPRGNTDISIQVPFSNLKKRADDYKPENMGVDKNGGRAIFLRGKPGSDGNIQFKLDLFKRFQKEKADSAGIKK